MWSGRDGNNKKGRNGLIDGRGARWLRKVKVSVQVGSSGVRQKEDKSVCKMEKEIRKGKR